MSDRFAPEKRSEIMARVRSKDTKIEIKVRHWLHHHGIRYRKNSKSIKGSPDISIKKYKVAIFVNGCFWHGHVNCKLSVLPKSRVEYWQNKITKNKERDDSNVKLLQEKGWHVFIVWECQLGKQFEETMNDIVEQIREIRTVSKKK